MSSLQSPNITILTMAGQPTTVLDTRRVLIITKGVSLPTASMSIVKNLSSEKAIPTLGDSMAYYAYKRFKKYNKSTPVDLLVINSQIEALEENFVSIGALSIKGAAVSSKSCTISIADDCFKVKINITKGDNFTAIADKIKIAVNDNDNIPFTCTIDANETDSQIMLLMHYKYKGIEIDGCTIVAPDDIDGVVFSNTVFSGGSDNYDISEVLNNISIKYDSIISDHYYNYDYVRDFLEKRFNTHNSLLGGSCFSCINGNIEELKTFANNHNSKVLTIFSNLNEMKINAIPLLLTTEIVAKRELRLFEGSNVSNLVLDSIESVGGVSKSSLPYHKTPLSYRNPIGEISLEAKEALEKTGVSVIVPTRKGYCELSSVITTYKRNLSDEIDLSFKYLNSIDTNLAIKEIFTKMCKSKFGQTRATHGSLNANMSNVNVNYVRSYLELIYDKCSELGLIQTGSKLRKEFINDMQVTLDSSVGRFDVTISYYIVSQFRGLFAKAESKLVI